jgi:hypothetical protein
VSTSTGPQSPPPTPAADEQPAAGEKPRRGTRGTVADMIRTMLVVLAVVGLVYLLVPRPNRIVPPGADVVGAAAAATSELGFSPLVPQDLPPDWVATEAAVRNAADGIKEFHIGYRSRAGQAGVEQATRLTDRFLEINGAGGTRVADVTIDGNVWEQRYKAERAYTSLLLRRPNQVLLVTSKDGGLAQAELLARALRVRTP